MPVEYEMPIPAPDEQIRLNKYMSNAGLCSRREADEFIQQGLVKVNGQVVTGYIAVAPHVVNLFLHELGVRELRGKVAVVGKRPLALPYPGRGELPQDGFF